MKIFGIIRKVDGLGRIVLPTELRRAVNMKAGAEVQIELQGNKIVLTPVEFSCALCGSAEHLIPFEESLVCMDCAHKLSDIIKDVDNSRL